MLDDIQGFCWLVRLMGKWELHEQEKQIINILQNLSGKNNKLN